ncbi:flippase [Vibrio sp. 431]|uniref:flippase n=1 Tax=Vibrio TaxID=662 RepID=UPI0029641850|nr:MULTISPECIES: flippase [unclassified Vibrio]MDW1964769.1 flippase [Vibrio sp. Vb0587]MDW2006640.1 flippase [Vibrio sp. 431]
MKIGKPLANIKWLFLDKILKMVLSLVSTLLIARYLGPEDYGVLTLAISIVVMVSTISFLGIKQILVKYIVLDPKNANSYLSTSLAICLVINLILVMSFYLLWWNDESELIVMLSIIISSIIIKTTDLIRSYFEAKVEAKRVVIIENVSLSIGMIFKLAVIYYGGDIVQFAFIYLFESMLLSFGLLSLILKVNDTINIKFVDYKITQKMLKEGWPLLISSSAWIIYTRVDQFMLASLLGNKSVGIYSAAIKVADLIVIVPSVISVSLIPLAAKHRDEAVSNQKFQEIYNLTTVVSLVICIACFACSGYILPLFYGKEYIEAINVFDIYLWTSIFVSMASVSGKYLMYLGKQKITMYRHTLGVAINIPLNYMLIKIYGVDGAALSTLVCLILTNLILDWFVLDTRICFYHKIRSFSFIRVFKMCIERFYNAKRRFS